jgi:hypothetical protein
MAEGWQANWSSINVSEERFHFVDDSRGGARGFLFEDFVV